MPGGEMQKVSCQDIQLVKDLIEHHLQLYMNQKEVVDTLSLQAKIEPSFTELVWQRLEKENQEFFKAYHVRLMLKNQILVFNKLLEKQVELMHKVCPSGVASMPLSNGSNSSTLRQTPSCYLPEHASMSSRLDSMLCNGATASAIINDRPAGEGVQLGGDASILTGSLETSTSMLSTQSSTMGRLIGINGTAIKSEPTYASNSEFPFCTDSGFLETHRLIGDAPAGSFGNSELTGQPLNSLLLDEPFGFLSQIPQDLSFSDLADHFAQSAGIIENYGRSLFLPPEANNFSDSPGECKEGENRRLDSISEGVNYKDFVTDW
ncbi:uncharacterized protein LOC103714431 isoform X1 [Phoenix dactylifera]|uniref:Uncharacterized protein LOC103714431 isoform X1 n=1 Tax=Phoenix dactylifera TaxID=42345 RepID=A0A8B7CIM0_PHODC|nr:uncharacterized protein LOC103714431 isoform X1 [Phoenix dactylifera]XP_008799895.2 uncharacterized protein LOC103714431 isoform X1 [Phoenix dactylifera]